jgi:group I intron endonuclease
MKQLTKENLRTITKSSGIYYIKAYECNYVGSTRSLKKRLLEHLNTLKKNKHDNPRMQNIFNKYGIKEFYFSILEVHAS